ncbi:LysM domain-containing protein [Apiospora marii]|uniref:LysM domain-containing protein n=1 Tax=Apiospora marii TaxID=335849 RepID=A0ABR1SAG5_9PEZI
MCNTASPTQPNLVDNCNAFYLVKAGESCDDIANSHGITLAQFLAFNPAAGSTCSGLWANAYACVSTIGMTPAPPTTTQPSNGVITPVPTQIGMVSDCNKFHMVENGQSCSVIASLYSISVAQFVQWNPAVKSDCSGLWSSTYACVGLLGGGITAPPPTTTTTDPGNGIATPTPTQPGMVNNCDEFYLVKAGDTCASIASSSRISMGQLVDWNPAVGNGCNGLWLDAYVCISIIGHTPTPVQPGNGVTTPAPIQSGMTGNCKSFHFVQSGDTCASITSRYGIPLSSFVSWNPAVGSSCTGMWADTYACVAVL